MSETAKPRIVTIPTFEIVDCPTINLAELREKGMDCVIRNQAIVDGELRVFRPPTTVGKVVDSLCVILDLIEFHQMDV